MPFDLVKPHTKDLGSFTVKRLLPSAAHRLVGPFIFFDHMGPALMQPGQGANVRPHPHIGLATVTYLFAGSMLHRDSLGTVQNILPGDVNWMTAGRGIVHSERNTPEDMRTERNMHGIQTWVALPLAHEQDAPAFVHHPASSLPIIEFPGVNLRLIAGTAYERTAPTPVRSPTLYAAAEMSAGSSFALPAEHEERAVYVVQGDVTVEEQAVAINHMAVLTSSNTVRIAASSPAIVMLLGGAKLEGERFINWNFVASSRERINAARESWKNYPNEQFGQVPDETEFIPLPD